MKFRHLKIVSGAVDVRKWGAKWRNWNISDILLFEFNRGAKAAEASRNNCAVYGDNVVGESTATKWFFVLWRIVLTLVTLHIQKTIPPLCDICIQWARFKNRVYVYRML